MKKFTVILSFNDGTYISQVRSESEREVVFEWLKALNIKDVDGLTKKTKERLSDALKLDYNQAVELDGLENVFCVSCTIRGKLFLINFIETVDSGGSG